MKANIRVQAEEANIKGTVLAKEKITIDIKNASLISLFSSLLEETEEKDIIAALVQAGASAEEMQHTCYMYNDNNGYSVKEIEELCS